MTLPVKTILFILLTLPTEIGGLIYLLSHAFHPMLNQKRNSPPKTVPCPRSIHCTLDRLYKDFVICSPSKIIEAQNCTDYPPEITLFYRYLFNPLAFASNYSLLLPFPEKSTYGWIQIIK